MNLIITKLDRGHLHLVGAFSCMETEEQLKGYKSNERRRIKKHSKEMENFLKEEALEEQKKGLNTTHLFIDTETDQIVGYLSLCNDSIGLELEERTQKGYAYATVPAIKVARLAVATKFQRMGLGKMCIDFCAYISQKLRSMSGVAFITLDCYEHRVSYYESMGFMKNSIQYPTRKYDTPISMRLSIDEYLEHIGGDAAWHLNK